MASIDERIANIEQILADGVSSVSRGGRTVSYDLDQLRIELQRLQRQKNQSARGSITRRVVYNDRFRA